MPPSAEASVELVAAPDDATDPAPTSADPLRVLAAAVAGVGASAAVPVTALMGGPALLTFCMQLVAAAVVAAALDVAARRLHDPVVAATARVAAVAALVVTVLAGLPAAVAGIGGITAVLLVGLPAWDHGALDDAVVLLGRTSGVAELPGDVRAAAVGLVLVWILAAAAALLGRRVRAGRSLLAWTGAAVVLAAIPALGPVAVVAGAYLAASAGALAWRVSVPAAPLVALSLAAGALAWAASWASTSTWWVVAPAVVLLLVAGSRTARSEGASPRSPPSRRRSRLHESSDPRPCRARLTRPAIPPCSSCSPAGWRPRWPVRSPGVRASGDERCSRRSCSPRASRPSSSRSSAPTASAARSPDRRSGPSRRRRSS
ncbi:hypothetical protein [Clavibacter michiganensis]|uniref:hypothetical protein n=1 Tax=Clavibacter michiganensis TaxID=28447 RepID=UPI003C724467